MEELIREIEKYKIIAIVRGVNFLKMEPLFEALYDGGIKHVEITLNTKDACKSIDNMNNLYGSRMVIGAGTVLNAKMAKDAINAGARFLVSPNVDEGMITTAISHNVLPIPGAMTPTEIAQAINYGASMIKLFPVSILGPKYIKELTGPFDNLKIIAVGGISIDNAKEYMEYGAVGLGIGGSLINNTIIEDGDFKAITDYAKKLRNSIL